MRRRNLRAVRGCLTAIICLTMLSMMASSDGDLSLAFYASGAGFFLSIAAGLAILNAEGTMGEPSQEGREYQSFGGSYFDEGANAYWDEIPLGKNPYPKGSREAAEWFDGWTRSKDEVEHAPRRKR